MSQPTDEVDGALARGPNDDGAGAADRAADGAANVGGTTLTAAERERMLRLRLANPDDPIGVRPPADARGPRPGPDVRGAQGRIAIVQGQVYLVGALVIAQLFLITTALYELLSGNPTTLWWISLACLIGFLLALLIALWPRRNVNGF